MSIFSRRSKDPAWFPETRQFCRSKGIEIMAWGPEMLVVEAKSPDRAKEIALQLDQLGFKVVESEEMPTLECLVYRVARSHKVPLSLACALAQ